MTMLRNKNITFSLMLMCLIVVSPIANAQLIGGSGNGGSGLGGIGSLFGGLPDVFNIQGLLMCSATGTVSTNNETSTPPFPNADVVFQCDGRNVSSTTTTANGLFSIPTVGTLLSPSSVLNSACRLIVTTPLSNCNVSLPANGILMAPLSLAGTAAGGGLNIFSIVPSAFSLLPFV
ncbi:hypothetical protein Bca52824_020865 [Brassica carinata]|uniref:Phylloplanin-like n=1 Tax=Brassica carinata TaxID=52824 RepID=A0A8X7VVT3_BRACI|nr:hypothetical protein Bca52824_020865 [Brassica carinata]